MTANPTEVMTEDATIKAMVDRFLGWRLPYTFSPDAGITFVPVDHQLSWPIGTNLFTATEARQMLEHVLGDTLTSLRSSRDEADKKLAFLKSKGITVDYMKTSDQPEPYLAYNIASGSELDELPTVNKLIEAQVALGKLKDEYEAMSAYVTQYQNTLKSNQKLLAESEAKVARMEAGHRESERQFAAKCDEIGKLMDDLSAARAEVSRLSGELASRPAKELVEAATMARDWFAISHTDFCNKHNGGRDIDPFMLRRCIHDKLDSALSQASSADALSAPAKEAPVAGETRTCAICGQSGRDMRELTSTETFSTLLGTVGISAYAWVCKSHRSAPVAAPASAVSPASEEKDAKKIMCDTCGQVVSTDRAEVINTELYSNLVRCTSCQTKYPKKDAPQPAPAEATPAPAPSEDYPGVRVWQSQSNSYLRRIWDGKLLYHLFGEDDLQQTGSSIGIVYTTPCDTELHGPERLAVIEKALTLKPDLFGAPGAAKKDHLQEGAEKVEPKQRPIEKAVDALRQYREMVTNLCERIDELEAENANTELLAKFTAAALTGVICETNAIRMGENIGQAAVRLGKEALDAMKGGAK